MKTTTTFLSALTLMGLTLLSAGHTMGQATVQIFHAAGDTNIRGVDVWLGNAKILSAFGYLRSTPTLTVPSGVELQVRIKPPGSTDTSNPRVFKRYTLAPNNHYVIIGIGRLAPAPLPQPDGLPTDFDLGVLAWGTATTLDPHTTGYRFFNTVIDASALSLTISGNVARIINHTHYGEFSNYVAMPSQSLNVDCNDSRGYLVKRYDLGAYGRDDSLISLIATGFENDGMRILRPFQIWGVMRSGRTFQLAEQVVQSAKSFTQMGVTMYPNPANQGRAYLVADGKNGSVYDVEVIDLIGRPVYHTRAILNGRGLELNLQGMAKGTYTVRVIDEKQNMAQNKLMI